jgi:hypothetical protein
MGVRIERAKPRCPDGEHPHETSRGYELADPQKGREWHFVKNATYVKSLEEAADLIEARGFAIRMSCPGKRPSLILPIGVRIIRD